MGKVKTLLTMGKADFSWCPVVKVASNKRLEFLLRVFHNQKIVQGSSGVIPKVGMNMNIQPIFCGDLFMFSKNTSRNEPSHWSLYSQLFFLRTLRNRMILLHQFFTVWRSVESQEVHEVVLEQARTAALKLKAVIRKGFVDEMMGTALPITIWHAA